MHYYKMNIPDWALSTAHLTLEEEAIYFRLINHYYDTETNIPLETQSVFRRLRLGSHSDLALSILEEFFCKTEKGYAHKKCDNLIKEYKKTANKNKKNGALGGRPRKHLVSEETQSVSSGLPDGTQADPKHNLNYKPLTNNQELVTKDIGEKAKRFSPPSQKEVSDCFFEKGSTDIEAVKFFNFYESKGWMVGKNKMKSWRAAVSNWISRNKEEATKPKGFQTAREKSADRNAQIFDYEKATTF